MITYRKATLNDIRPALDLALRAFMEFDALDYGLEHTERMRLSIEDRIKKFNIYISGERLMLVAVDGEKVVGMIETYGNNRISLMFVDGSYQRKGIATELMSRTICELKMNGYDKIVLSSSPHGLPFYKSFGFMPIESEKNINTPWKTPMEYIPNEIWDVLDENGNKTGRFHERGRKMATGDYHLCVHVWKYNDRGEWLIDKRTRKSTDDTCGGKWETTGGAAIAGEDSLAAALRETKEELGLDLAPEKGLLFRRFAREGFYGHTYLMDVWVFKHDCVIEDVRFAEHETCEAMWATVGQIRELITNNKFFSDVDLYFDEMVEKWSKENG